MGGGYQDAPWHFKGKALYQLSLVKVEEAKKYVPPELPLVNFFGWTLGGFYLARYSDSPVGPFDEMVAMAGLAWNFPSSCAWAARVYVNNREARNHGIHEVGLPSRLASFRALPLPQLRAGSQAAPKAASGSGSIRGSASSSSSGAAAGDTPASEQQDDSLLDRALGKFQTTRHSWWDHNYHRHDWFGTDSKRAVGSSASSRGGSGSGSRGGGSDSAATAAAGTWAVELSNKEPRRGGGLLSALFRTRGRRGTGRGLAGGPVCRIELPPQPHGQGPRISMCLPSFSGATPDYPGFLQYDLQLQANIRPVPPARVAFPSSRPKEDQTSPEVLDLVLGGRPLLCLEFGNMEMEVQAPVPWRPRGL